MDNLDITKVENEYGANDIQVLEGLEAVRKRPGMYIGSPGPAGLHHLVYEIVDNSIDEALAGYCTKIDVEILPENIIKVKDEIKNNITLENLDSNILNDEQLRINENRLRD